MKNIFRIPTEYELQFMNFSDEYDIEKTVAEGHFAKIFLAKHKITQTNVILKALHKELTSIKEFIKEFHYNYQLSHHPCILSCYQVKFYLSYYHKVSICVFVYFIGSLGKVSIFYRGETS